MAKDKTISISSKRDIIANADQIKQAVITILEIASQKGASSASAGAVLNYGCSTQVRCGELETVEHNRDKSVGITVYDGKRKGNVSTTDIDVKSLEQAVTAALNIAKYTEEDPCHGLAEKNLMAKDLPDLKLYYPEQIKHEVARDLALECEAKALAYSEEIVNSEGVSFSENERYAVYGNSYGFLGSFPSSSYSLSCAIIGSRGGKMQTDYDYSVVRNFKEMTASDVVAESAAAKVVSHLGAQKIKTCKAPVLFIPEKARSLLSAFIAAISGGSLYRKASFLLDSLNTKVFPEFINIKEQPHLFKGWGSRAFDNEGVATNERDLIASGILQGYVLNSYAARRLNMQTTGNAGGVHNLILQGSDDSYEDLLKIMHQGLIVTTIMGHGANIVTGDYSQGAKGYWVENGKIQYPVDEVTIAGNLKDIFANIVATGNDLDYRSNVITGSILVSEMTIAGR